MKNQITYKIEGQTKKQLTLKEAIFFELSTSSKLNINRDQKELIESICKNPDKYYYNTQFKSLTQFESLEAKSKIPPEEKILSILTSNFNNFQQAIMENTHVQKYDELYLQDKTEIQTFQSIQQYTKLIKPNISEKMSKQSKKSNYWDSEMNNIDQDKCTSEMNNIDQDNSFYDSIIQSEFYWDIQFGTIRCSINDSFSSFSSFSEDPS